MANVLMSTVFTGGDIHPFVAMGAELVERGHRVTLLTHCFYEEKVRRRGIEFFAIDTPAQWEAFLRDAHLFNTPRGFFQIYQRHVLPTIERELSAYPAAASPDTVIVTRYAPGIAARIAAERTAIPLVSVMLSPTHALTREMALELMRALNLDALRRRCGSTLDLEPWWLQPVADIGLWPEWFAFDEEALKGVRQVGFVTDLDADRGEIPESITNLLSQAASPPILVTGGQAVILDRAFFTRCVQTCVDVGRSVILVSQFDEQVPRPLPNGVVRVDKYVPFRKLVGSVGALIHHGGTGTMAEALGAAVPQVIVGVGGDRQDHGERIRRLEVGTHLPAAVWREPSARRELERVIQSEQVRLACRRFADRMQQDHAIEAACTIIEGAASKSSQSSS
jgi:UDP:flavonoid glycosyltransferase YjiC (YdhE family)